MSSDQHTPRTRKEMDPLLYQELKGNHANVPSDPFMEAMWLNQGIDIKSQEWATFTQGVTSHPEFTQLLEEIKGIEEEKRRYIPLTNLMNLITALFKDDKAFGKECKRKVAYLPFGDHEILSAPFYGDGEQTTTKCSRRKPDGVGAIDFEDGATSQDPLKDWRSVVLCMELKSSSKKHSSTTTPCVSGSNQSTTSRTDPTPSTNSSQGVSSQHSLAVPNTSLYVKKSGKQVPANRRFYSESDKGSQPLSAEIQRLSLASRNAVDVSLPLSPNAEAELESVGPKTYSLRSHHSHTSSAGASTKPKGGRINEDPPIVPVKKLPDAPLGRKLQLASYALEMLFALGNRTHVFGIFMTGHNITLSYFDRSGAIFSDLNIDVENDVEKLVTFIVAFSAMDTKGLGFNSDLVSEKGVKPESREALAPANLKGFTINLDGKQVVLDKLIEYRYGLVTRATLVYLGALEGVTDHQVIIKLSWQPTARRPEWEFISSADSRGCPKEHLVEVYAHAGLMTLSKGFRSRFTDGTNKVAFEDRELRVMVSERLFPVAKLETKYLMWAIWLLIEGIHHLDEAGIRHRDVSIGNFGWTMRRRNSGEAGSGESNPKRNESGELVFIAVLYDFDLAKDLRCTNAGPSSDRRTGTAPFMAISLLKNIESEHIIRFDYESGFWLMWWYSFGSKDNGTSITMMDLDWPIHDFGSLAKHKTSDLLESLPNIRRKNQTFRQGMENLQQIFRQAYLLQLPAQGTLLPLDEIIHRQALKQALDGWEPAVHPPKTLTITWKTLKSQN